MAKTSTDTSRGRGMTIQQEIDALRREIARLQEELRMLESCAEEGDDGDEGTQVGADRRG
jgi:prefoldin subunit 5